MGCFFCKITNTKRNLNEKLRRLYNGEDKHELEYVKYNSSDYRPIKFDPEYKLEENEVFYIENFKEFTKKKEFIELNCGSSSNQNILEGNELSKIKLLIYDDNGDKYFQRICNNKYLNKKIYLSICRVSLANGIELKKEPVGIQINKIPDVVYIESEDRIYFENFVKVHKIFDEIDELYREATDDEIRLFLSHEYIKSEISDISKISVNKRKKIALVQDRLNEIYTKKIDIIKYAKEYAKEVVAEEKINIKDLDTLDIVLNLFLEKYYTGGLSNKKMKSNSSTILK